MRLPDRVSKKITALSSVTALDVVKRLDKIFASEAFGTKYEPDAWYYDKAKVREYLAKNTPWKPGFGFFSQDWEALITFRIKFLLNYPTFQLYFITMLAVLYVCIIAVVLILLQ